MSEMSGEQREELDEMLSDSICPYCGEPKKYSEDIGLYCDNSECPAYDAMDKGY